MSKVSVQRSRYEAYSAFITCASFSNPVVWMFSSTTPQDALALSTNTARFAPRLSASRPIWAGARKQVEKHAALQIKLQNVEKRLFYAVRRGTHSIARSVFNFLPRREPVMIRTAEHSFLFWKSVSEI